MKRTPKSLPAYSRNIKRARAMLELSQQALAERAGLSLATISHVERGRSVNSDTLEAIGRALGMSAADLLREPARKR